MLGIIAAAIVAAGYLVLTSVSRNRIAKKYEDGYAQIKVGDSKETVIGVLGQPTRMSECVYPWFTDQKLEAEYRSNCKEVYEYDIFPVSYTISFEKKGQVINKTRAVSP